ncbi:unnamed protein product [Vicia faba]|uniref:Peroxidase n=1 Tax=Vicia faba TaxID=3906 RepID=A0AAV1B721_VICFA|nr:unnamed protein product [Vicia faba]
MAYRMITTSFVVTLVLLSTICDAQLSSTFYDTTCPDALTTIRTAIRTAVSKERRMAASLIRLHFHDCFVQGCDASILLNDSTTIESEKTALPNLNSVRGFQVIDNAKSQVEKVCPGVVSCADIVAVAARDASFAVGGPSWTVKLGRRDSTTASKTLANTHLPLFTDDLQTLISKFTIKDLTAKDMVTLSGAHTIGQAQCFTFRDRIYNNASDIDAGFASTRQRVLLSTICDAQLSSTFYDTTCPDALTTIRTAIRTAVSKERRMAASLIRLHFHDCFVQGCDASILLNDSTTIESEKTALPNLNSVRGFQVIDNAKSQVEKVCPGVVSCADIVAVAARDASFAVSLQFALHA